MGIFSQLVPRAPPSNRLSGSLAPFRLVRQGKWMPFFVGSILLLASLLKAHRLFFDPLSETGLLASPVLQLILIETELAFALALLFGFWCRSVRILSLLLFLAFAATSSVQALNGVRSCACFGNVILSPWVALTLDLAIIFGLWVWNPQRGDYPPPKSQGVFQRLRGTLGLTSLAVIPFFFVVGFHKKELPLVVSPALLDLGTVNSGRRVEFSLRLLNVNSDDVVVERVDGSCPCLHAKELPWRVGPGQEKLVDLTLDLGNEADFIGELFIRINARTDSGAGAGAGQLHVLVVPS